MDEKSNQLFWDHQMTLVLTQHVIVSGFSNTLRKLEGSIYSTRTWFFFWSSKCGMEKLLIFSSPFFVLRGYNGWPLIESSKIDQCLWETHRKISWRVKLTDTGNRTIYDSNEMGFGWIGFGEQIFPYEHPIGI